MVTNDATDKAKDAVDTGADALDDAVQSTARTASRNIYRARDKAEDALNRSQDMMEDAVACAKEMIRENPITSVLTVAAVAYLIGKLRG
jgi:ElaB/YqjD/DUF883 family membrane-anchored ribosome-binding protein